MQFNERLKQLRLKKKLTQQELADILGLKPTAVSNYESNRNEPSFEKLIILSQYFNVSLDYLLGISESYLPIQGEVLDREIVEFFNQYKNLDSENAKLLRDYAEYLFYRQSKKTEQEVR